MASGVDGLPLLPVTRVVLRDSKFIDIEVRGDALGDLDGWGLSLGDVVEFLVGFAPMEPVNGILVMDTPVRKGAIITARIEGPRGEEGRVLSKKMLKGSCYTLLRDRPKGEFTVHRHITVESDDLLKLHFAHGAQLMKMQLSEGAGVSVKEKPCGILDWNVVEAHTEDLENCPNCGTGLKGPRRKEFNAADLCKPGTQYAVVRPKEQLRKGFFFFAERDLPAEASIRLVMRAADRPPEEPVEEKIVEGPGHQPRQRRRSQGRTTVLRSRSRAGRGSTGAAARLRSRSRRGGGGAGGGGAGDRAPRRRGDEVPTHRRSRSRRNEHRHTPPAVRKDYRAVPPPRYDAVPLPRYDDATHTGVAPVLREAPRAREPPSFRLPPEGGSPPWPRRSASARSPPRQSPPHHGPSRHGAMQQSFAYRSPTRRSPPRRSPPRLGPPRRSPPRHGPPHRSPPGRSPPRHGPPRHSHDAPRRSRSPPCRRSPHGGRTGRSPPVRGSGEGVWGAPLGGLAQPTARLERPNPYDRIQYPQSRSPRAPAESSGVWRDPSPGRACPPSHRAELGLAASDWEELHDPDGRRYYLHRPSGRTQWDPPQELGGHGDRAGGAAGPEDWEIVEDERGGRFYYHTPSGRAQWDSPAAHGARPTLGGDAWGGRGLETEGPALEGRRDPMWGQRRDNRRNGRPDAQATRPFPAGPHWSGEGPGPNAWQAVAPEQREDPAGGGRSEWGSAGDDMEWGRGPRKGKAPFLPPWGGPTAEDWGQKGDSVASRSKGGDWRCAGKGALGGHPKGAADETWKGGAGFGRREDWGVQDGRSDREAAWDVEAQVGDSAAPRDADAQAGDFEPHGLHQDWEECQDDDGNVYYHNTLTGDSQWEPPGEFWSSAGPEEPREAVPSAEASAEEAPGARRPAEKGPQLDSLRKRAEGLGIQL